MKCKFANYYSDSEFLEFVFADGTEQGSFNFCTQNHVAILKVMAVDGDVADELYEHFKDLRDICRGKHEQFNLVKCRGMANNKATFDINMKGCLATIEVEGNYFFYIEKDKHYDAKCESDAEKYIRSYFTGENEI